MTAGSTGQYDVGVRAGKIIQLGGSLHGRRELDARAAYVLPGGVDMHVHLSQPSPPEPGTPAWVDDFGSGSRAAIAGGITTVGNMTFPWPGQTLAGALERDLAAAAGTAAVDYVLHPVLLSVTPDTLAELPRLAAAGHASLKLFMVMPEFETQIDDMLAAIAMAGRSGLLTLLHCEDGALVRFTGARLLARQRGGVADWGLSRPDSSERAAVERAVAICAATGAPVCIVHLSSAAALESARRGQASGLPVFVETRPLYLHLTSAVLAEPDAGKYIGSPPLREQADQDRLWAALADGSVHALGSDHAPWSLADKTDPAQTVENARQGVADLETMLPMLFSAGVRTGRISLSRFAELTSATPARLFGQYPRKGTIMPGSDGDLIVLDPERGRVIDGATMQSRAGYSPYDGREVFGWPRFTVSRGEVVLADGEVMAAPGRGQWLPRQPADGAGSSAD